MTSKAQIFQKSTERTNMYTLCPTNMVPGKGFRKFGTFKLTKAEDLKLAKVEDLKLAKVEESATPVIRLYRDQVPAGMYESRITDIRLLSDANANQPLVYDVVHHLTQFWNGFNERKPYIMDAIFRTLQEAMRIYPTLQTGENLHRMADAQLEMEAIALAMGLTREECRKLISQNELEMQKAYAASNPFIETILDYFLSQGKPFIEMRMQAMIDDIREKRPAARSHVPAFPSPFSQKLNLDKSVLEMFGVRYIRKKDNAGAIVRLEKIPKKALTSEQKDMIQRREELREELEKYDSILSEYDIPEEEETPEKPVKKSGFKKLIPEKQQKVNWYDEEDTEPAADTDSASVDH